MINACTHGLLVAAHAAYKHHSLLGPILTLSFSVFARSLTILLDSRLPHANDPAERCDREVRNLGYGRPGACDMGAQTDHDARANEGDQRRAEGRI